MAPPQEPPRCANQGATAIFPIHSSTDLVKASQEARAIAQRLGFPSSDMTRIATVVSELARNIIQFAGTGEIILENVDTPNRRGIRVIARDWGPGIPDVHQALQFGFSSAQGLGIGLPGSKRLMDEFQIDTKPGEGTTVIACKWCQGR